MPDLEPSRLPPDQDRLDEALAGEAAAWFARLRAEGCTTDERRACEAWQAQSPDHAAAFEEIRALWDDPSLRAACERVCAPPDGPRGLPRRSRGARPRAAWLALAASVAGLATLAGWQLDIPERVMADYRTAMGERRVVQLSDHSAVTLNSHSAIDEAFDARTRRVHLLKGEAFFEVAHDRQKPFVVESRHIAVRAVGTAFVVREEPDGIRVTVAEGVVELAPVRAGWAPLRLTAGQQVGVSAHGPGLVREADVTQAMAWLRGRLVVDGARLADVLEELRRYYPGTIQVWSPAIGDLRVSGSYSLDDPAGVLDSLVRTFPVRMVRFTDHAVILF